MDPDFTSQPVGAYSVVTPLYEGPLDLLLKLIERAEMDITKLSLAQVTNQYLSHLANIRYRAVAEMSTFLVLAAKLIQIKSEILLPRPPVRESGEIDEGDMLVQQLLVYRQYKKIAIFLAQRQTDGLQTFLRTAPPPHFEAKLDMGNLTLDDLLASAQIILHQLDRRPALKTIVAPSQVTIRQKISLIVNTIKRSGRATFQTILKKTRSRLEVVVTFIAMLELIKRRQIYASQSSPFGEIVIEPTEVWDETDLDEIELEFGE